MNNKIKFSIPIALVAVLLIVFVYNGHKGTPEPVPTPSPSPVITFNPVPEYGDVIDETFFDNSIFLGDSLINDISANGIDAGNAMICGYKGMGPDRIVFEHTMVHEIRGDEKIQDIFIVQNPKRVFVLLGTNSLSALNNDDFFVEYYEKMLVKLKEWLPVGGTIYIHSIPPVEKGISDKKIGLKSERIQTINSRLKDVAAKNEIYFIDLWEVLSEDGTYLNPDYAAEDGIHLNENGYKVWFDKIKTISSAVN